MKTAYVRLKLKTAGYSNCSAEIFMKIVKTIFWKKENHNILIEQLVTF